MTLNFLELKLVLGGVLVFRVVLLSELSPVLSLMVNKVFDDFLCSRLLNGVALSAIVLECLSDVFC